MAGTAVTPVPIAGIDGGASGASNNVLDPSKVNSFRISAVIDRLSILPGGSANNDNTEFLNLCLSLARGIDFAIANHEVPSRGQELPSLLKQVCQCKNDAFLQSAIMVLMVSVKNACQCGWFSDKDSNELRNLAKEIASNFCGISNYDTEATCSLSVISTIMSRFYPRMRMGHKLAFLEAKPGFDAYVSGFHISKNLKPSPTQKIRLFVVQTDSIMTSSCLISPSKVNFLLNGKGVERRINVSMDTGPQVPTDVTHMLKYGSNLLQAVGEFNGNYVIAVSFMSDLPNPESSNLQEYEQHAPATVDSDSEIIEGSSRISLNCPISFKRIRTPVKGHSCKHIQCFDYDNYVDMNSRRPSWRCPHCNQHVCFTDIRVDQKMVEVLKDVGTNTTEVIVASDGSWKAAMEIDDATQKQVDKNSNIGQDESPQREFVGLSNSPVDVTDLTHTDDAINCVGTHEAKDRKFSPTFCQSQSAPIMILNSQAETNDANRSSSQVENDFVSGIYLSTFGQGSSNVQPMTQIAGVSVASSNNIMLPTVLNYPTAPAPSQEVEAFDGNAFVTTPIAQIETSLPTTLQLQQYQLGNSIITNEYGRFPSIPRHISRTSTVVQGLPAQVPISVLQRRSRNSMNTLIHNGTSVASPASPTAQISSTSPLTNPFHVSQRSSSPSHQLMGTQRNHSFPSVGPSQLNVPDKARNTYRVLNECLISISQKMVNPRMPQAMSQSPAMIQSSLQSSANFLRPQIQLGVSRDRTDHPAVSVQQTHTMVSTNRNVQMARPVETSRTTPPHAMTPDGRRMQDQGGNTGVTSLPVTINAYDSAEQNWRPAGRMRGALSGQAYNDALNQYIIRPSQQAQAARPINPSSAVPNVSGQLQALMADRAAQRPSAPHYPAAGSTTSPGGSPNYPAAGSTTSPGGSSILPEGSSGMN